ncbi:helix-turn-helix domain-containing protein [Actinopolymorpha singaporensis]|uniref:DprA-like winged helix domain-containing protein n=1 Tax=Actinopolymorpha singaporensis TaxID=117157 RepID=UPI0012FD80C5|nr:helix-turn-helix domain-containing protein [Actinopolymorpha singaporensis]
MRRRPLLLFLVVATVALVPWIGFLLVTLPDQYQTRHWRLAWVGFDLALVVLLGLAAWFGWRRRRAAVPLLVATAALLCCDAWFDVVLDWNSPDRWLSLATAVLVEVPIAVLLAVRARTIVTAGVASRELTVHDIELVLGNPSAQRLLTLLGTRVMTTDELAAAASLSREEVRATLRELSRAGYVEAAGQGWRDVPLNLRAPRPEDFAEADRPRFEAFWDARLAHELKLFRRAFRHPERFGPWAQGSRARLLLSQGELRRFADEYLELLDRYQLLHADGGGDGDGDGEVRAVALRFYAFPDDLLTADTDSASGRAVPVDGPGRDTP